MESFGRNCGGKPRIPSPPSGPFPALPPHPQLPHCVVDPDIFRRTPRADEKAVCKILESSIFVLFWYLVTDEK